MISVDHLCSDGEAGLSLSVFICFSWCAIFLCHFFSPSRGNFFWKFFGTWASPTGSANSSYKPPPHCNLTQVSSMKSTTKSVSRFLIDDRGSTVILLPRWQWIISTVTNRPVDSKAIDRSTTVTPVHWLDQMASSASSSSVSFSGFFSSSRVVLS